MIEIWKIILLQIRFPSEFSEQGGREGTDFTRGVFGPLVTTLLWGILYFSKNAAAIFYAKCIFRTNVIEILLATSYTSSQIHVTERTSIYPGSRCRDDGTRFHFGRLGPDEIHYRDDFHFDSKNGPHACLRFTRI